MPRGPSLAWCRAQRGTRRPTISLGFPPIGQTRMVVGLTHGRDHARRVASRDRAAGRRGISSARVAERTASGRADLDDERVTRLEFRGFLAMVDPVRPTAAQAVTGIQAAGVLVMMLTGDDPHTARAVAGELGFDDGVVLTGGEVDAMDDGELADALRGSVVFARASPAHKVCIVEALRRAGNGRSDR
jgi:cation-transporting P-type ATPase I